MDLGKLTKLTEDGAREYLEGIRWPEGPICPRCGTKDAALLRGKSTRPGVYKCRAKGCRKPFTVTVGTIFEGSHIELRLWLMAFHLMCSSKKGISALQLQRNLGLRSYQSAWFMAHRIRHAMEQEPFKDLLHGTIEADETYVGGKPRRGGRMTTRGKQKKIGRGTAKTPVFALVERGGRVRARVVPDVSADTLKAAIREQVDRSRSRLMTDEWRSYGPAGKGFRGGHEVVCHSKGEYARGKVHTNTVEGFFSILKRGVTGTFHSVSKKHLPRYLNEFCFRYDGRKLTDGERTLLALKLTEGRRLRYSMSL